MRIVEFSDGTFGIQVKRFPRVFVDLLKPNERMGKKDDFFHRCKGTREKVLEVFIRKNYKVVRYHKAKHVKEAILVNNKLLNK